MNRQIKTGQSEHEGFMLLEVVKPCKIGGKSYEAGKVIKCTRSQARRFLAADKTLLKIKVD